MILNKILQEMAKNCPEQALILKETLKAKGIYTPIFDEICNVIKKTLKTDSVRISIGHLTRNTPSAYLTSGVPIKA